MKKIDETKYKKFETQFEYFPDSAVSDIEFSSVDDLKNNNISNGPATYDQYTVQNIQKTIDKKQLQFYTIKREYIDGDRDWSSPHYVFTLTGWILMTPEQQVRAAKKKEKEEAKEKALEESRQILKTHLKRQQEEQEIELAKKLMKKYKDKL